MIDLLAFAVVASGLGTPFVVQLLWRQLQLPDYP